MTQNLSESVLYTPEGRSWLVLVGSVSRQAVSGWRGKEWLFAHTARVHTWTRGRLCRSKPDPYRKGFVRSGGSEVMLVPTVPSLQRLRDCPGLLPGQKVGESQGGGWPQ